MSPLDLIRRAPNRAAAADEPSAGDVASSSSPGVGSPSSSSSGGGTLAERVVARTAGLFGGASTRRRFLAKTAVVGSAIAVNPVTYLLKPGTAYGAVCGTCSDGWTAFCCTVNSGKNSCPPNTFVAGWWKADNAAYCGGGPRYIIDCNATCPTQCSCRCAGASCDGRRTCCNQFRYGQCNQHISCYGPVACRVAICITPWQYDAACSTYALTDNRTVQHGAACLKTEHNTAITRKYYALGGPDGFLGILTQTERTSTDGSGRYAIYEGGRIYYKASTGAHEVHGSIFSAWADAGGPGGSYRFPTSDTRDLPGGQGRYQTYEQGNIYAGLAGTYGVPEPHLGVYLAYGGHNVNSALGLPVGPVTRSSDGVALYINFERGRTYRRGSTAVEIHGAIFDKHESLGGVHGNLGHVKSSVLTSGDGRGRYSRFDGGGIYYTATLGAHAVWGAMDIAYVAVGGPASDVGFPTTDRQAVGDGVGDRVRLENGGVYYKASRGAFVVPGELHDRYLDRGGPTGSLGYPTGPATHSGASGFTQPFEGGTLTAPSPYVAFVRAAYQDFLDRAPTTAELSSQADALYLGTKSRATIVRELAYSDGYLTAVVNRFYVDTLGRPGGSGEVSYWIGLLRSGWSVARVAASFYASAEYFSGIGGGTVRSWIADLYPKLLQRSASSTDLDYWEATTASIGRGVVALRLFQSAESRATRVRGLYQDLLGRTPGASDVAYWSPRILTQGDLALAVSLASMAEYYDRAQDRFA